MSLADDLARIIGQSLDQRVTDTRDEILTLFADWCEDEDHREWSGQGISDEIRPKPRTVEIDREHLRTLATAVVRLADATQRCGPVTTAALNHVREIAPDVLS